MPFWDYVHFGRPGSSSGGGGGADEDDDRQYRHLQEGLRQIGLQSCNILVQVNNTNNISYGRHASNVQYNNFSAGFAGAGGGGGGGRSSRSRRGGADDDSDLNDVLIAGPSSSSSSTAQASSSALGVIKGSTRNLFSHYKHRLSVSAVPATAKRSEINAHYLAQQCVCVCLI